jgi:hypothetical protein
VLGVIVLGVIGRIASHDGPKGPASNSASSGSAISQPNSTTSQSSESRWEVSVETDKMTGKQQYFAASPTIRATKSMSFPYQDAKSWVAVGCNKGSKWAYFAFSTSPNLVKTEIHDGYNGIRARVKWDGAIIAEALTQKWGSAFLHFENDAHAINKLISSKSVLLELDWFGQNPVYFEYPMEGAAEAIKSLQGKCDGK